MRFQYFACAAFVGLLTGCASIAPVPLKSTFKPEQAAFIEQRGTGAISGQAFLRRNDGVVVYAAGSDVNIVPVTDYSSERIFSMYGQGKISIFHPGFASNDPLYDRYTRKTVADGEGRFSVTGLPAGSYFVTTSVQWMAGNVPQGGALLERVTLSTGQSVSLIMSGM